jgi:hydroxymethylglutaryl-CoA reductase
MKAFPPGFYRLTLEERRAVVRSALNAEPSTEDRVILDTVLNSGGISAERADLIVENVIGIYSLPLGLCLGIVLNGRERIAPMVVEEPSVIAAASAASKMIAAGGGVVATVEEPLMIAQIEVRGVTDVAGAQARIAGAEASLLASASEAIPNLIRRGGGPKSLEFRVLGSDHIVIHLLVDVRDAMGANLVNSAAERIGPAVAELCGGTLGLCILTNLTDRRVVRARCRVPGRALVGRLTLQPEEVVERIEAASVFAERDPYRAATHNKGIMNGIDSVVLATGNDYRATEAGAHAYAARDGRYDALGKWRRSGGDLEGTLELPLALGTVGGTIRVHDLAALTLRLAVIDSAADLSMLATAVGMASNLAALRALSTEGIQRGHMSLHARSVAVAAGANPSEVHGLAALLVERGTIDRASAESLLIELRSK